MRQPYTTMSWEKDHQWDFKTDKGESGPYALAYLYLEGKNGSTVSVGQNYRSYRGLQPPPGEETDYSHYFGDKIIPPTVGDGKKMFKVIKIAKWAFLSAAKVHKVTLPPTIEEIEDEAFIYCGGLNIINLNEGLKRIGYRAFFYCTHLQSISIPDSVTEIGQNAFQQCLYMTEVTIGAGITYMDKVFKGSENFEKVTCRAVIPPAITEGTFGDKVFENATLYVPFSSLEAYKRNSMWGKFSNIRAFSYDFVVNGLYYKITDKNNVCVVAGDNKGLYSNAVTIPNQVTHIYKGYKDGKLVEYSNTYKVTSIEEMAFADCNDLTEVVFDDTIISVGFKAFANCPNLTNVFCGINLPAADNTVFMNSPKAQFVQKKLSKGACIYLNGIFYRIETMENDINEVSVSKDRWNTLGSHEYKGHVTIPQTVNYAAKTFNVIYIDSFAFARCKELTGVTLPPMMWKIRNRAFLEAKNLKSITFGSYVVAIQNSAFDSCESLSEITFLDGMLRGKREKRTLHIYPNAFTNCKNLKRIVCERMTPPKIEDQNAFDQDVYDNATLVLKACDKEAYLNDPIWRRFYHIETIS